MIASERELREVKRCWRIIGARLLRIRANSKADNLSEIAPTTSRPERPDPCFSSAEEAF